MHKNWKISKAVFSTGAERRVPSEVLLFSVTLLHVRGTQSQEDAQRVEGLGSKVKRKRKRQPRRAPHQRLRVHPLLLKHIAVFGQLQLLQDFLHLLSTPAARGSPGPL